MYNLKCILTLFCSVILLENSKFISFVDTSIVPLRAIELNMLVSARDLPVDTSLISLEWPSVYTYAIVKYDDDYYSTSILEYGSDLDWLEVFSFLVQDADDDSATLEIQVWNDENEVPTFVGDGIIKILDILNSSERIVEKRLWKDGQVLQSRIIIQAIINNYNFTLDSYENM